MAKRKLEMWAEREPDAEELTEWLSAQDDPDDLRTLLEAGLGWVLERAATIARFGGALDAELVRGLLQYPATGPALAANPALTAELAAVLAREAVGRRFRGGEAQRAETLGRLVERGACLPASVVAALVEQACGQGKVRREELDRADGAYTALGRVREQLSLGQLVRLLSEAPLASIHANPWARGALLSHPELEGSRLAPLLSQGKVFRVVRELTCEEDVGRVPALCRAVADSGQSEALEFLIKHSPAEEWPWMLARLYELAPDRALVLLEHGPREGFETLGRQDFLPLLQVPSEAVRARAIRWMGAAETSTVGASGAVGPSRWRERLLGARSAPA